MRFQVRFGERMRSIIAGILCCTLCGCASLGERVLSGNSGRKATALNKLRLASPEKRQIALRECISALKASEPDRRRAASAALASIGRPAVPLLLEVARETDTAIVHAAVSVLKDMGEEGAEALPYLMTALKSRDFFLRSIASDAVVNIGAPAVPTLISLYTEDPVVGSDGPRRMLERIGSPAAKAIAEAALAADKGLKEKFYLLLLSIGENRTIEGALPSLLVAFADPKQSFGFPRALIESIGPPAAPELIKLLESQDLKLRQEASDLLARICFQKSCALDRYSSVLAAVFKDPDAKVHQNIEFLINPVPGLHEKIAKMREPVDPPQRIPPCAPPSNRERSSRIPASPDYFDGEALVSVLEKGIRIGRYTPDRIAFMLPDCGLSREELKKLVVVQISDKDDRKIFPTTIEDGKAVANVDSAGSFSLQIPFRAVDTVGPELRLKYLDSELTADISHISASRQIEVEAVDHSSHPFAVAGIGGVYVLFNKRPGIKCYGSLQKRAARFGSYENCVYSGPFLVPAGLQHIAAFSIDRAGNAGEPVLRTVYSDASPAKDVFAMNGRPLTPGSTIYAKKSDTFTIVSTDKLPQYVSPGNIKIHMIINLAESECAYSAVNEGIDGKWSCEAPFYDGPFILPSGEHSIYYHSEDAVGNLSEEKQIKIIIADVKAGG